VEPKSIESGRIGQLLRSHTDR